MGHELIYNPHENFNQIGNNYNNNDRRLLISFYNMYTDITSTYTPGYQSVYMHLYFLDLYLISKFWGVVINEKFLFSLYINIYIINNIFTVIPKSIFIFLTIYF